MLRMYSRNGNKLVPVNTYLPADPPIWLDLIAPSDAEVREVEQGVSVTLPTKAEMEEIELSARLYAEEDAVFMTLTALAHLDTDSPIKTPVTFILKGRSLVTVRYVEPKPFLAYLSRAQRPGGLPHQNGEQVMLGLIEAMIDRTADALERIGNDMDLMSREVFKKGREKADKKTRNLEALIAQVGHKGEMLTMVQESLVSTSRLVAYYSASQDSGDGDRTTKQLVRIIQRDATSLGDHARALSGRLDFLLNATLGLINLEQNQIIKIFSVAAVVFLPPTLVASIYGMNFDFMPELSWFLGATHGRLVLWCSRLSCPSCISSERVGCNDGLSHQSRGRRSSPQPAPTRRRRRVAVEHPADGQFLGSRNGGAVGRLTPNLSLAFSAPLPE